MRNDLTDLTLVVDRSGSMCTIRADAEGGINALLDDQKKEPGDCNLTLVQFDNEYEFVHKGIDISEAAHYSLHPRGATALLDAVGQAINATGRRLDEMKEEDRPSLVAFVITTDGHENCSREFTSAQIRKMISHQQSEYNWKFTYLGADADCFDEAESMGIDASGTAQYNVARSAQMFNATSQKMSRMRTVASCGINPDNSYTKDELKEMSDDSE